MPECPELHATARYITEIGKSKIFSGPIVKSDVSKNPEVPFCAKEYSLTAKARGKELKVFIQDCHRAANRNHLLFRFGMTGCFRLTASDELPKHAHLRFKTLDGSETLSFVDSRRFGHWFLDEDWGKERGPDPIMEYEDFRSNVLANLDKAAFNRPICEALLNQSYFNGIGNYLRSEILHRASVPPFDCARDVLQPLAEDATNGAKKKKKSKSSSTDLLSLCSTVPQEVLDLGLGVSYGYRSEAGTKAFEDWMRCYGKKTVNTQVDCNGRTVYFTGPAGSMLSKKAKSRKAKKDQ